MTAAPLVADVASAADADDHARSARSGLAPDVPSVDGVPAVDGVPSSGRPTASDRPPLRVATTGERERSLGDLVRELGSLASAIAAATARFLVLLAEFDRRGGYEHEGMASTTHWLSWRCGMSTTTAREHVRVARGLATLPQTTTAFAAGRLSYSKVRAITRVATAQTEPELVEVALAASANQLERFVAGVRSARNLEDVEERHRARGLVFRTDADGGVSFSGRCSPEDGAAILERLRLIQDYLDRTVADPTAAEPQGQDGRAPAGGGHALLDALVLLCEESDVGSSADASSADEALGSRRSETVLHVTLDELAGATARGSMIDTATTSTRAATDTATANAAAAAAIRPAAAGGRRGSASLIGARLEGGAALHPETARRLCCDTGLVLSVHEESAVEQGGGAVTKTVTVMANARPGRTLDLGRRRRLASRRQLRALWDRDHGCRFPGCDRRRYLHAHHVRHWADGGPTDLGNLVLLCGQHHRQLHEGGFTIELRGHRGDVLVTTAAGRKLCAVPDQPDLPDLPDLPDQSDQSDRVSLQALPDEPAEQSWRRERPLPLDPIGGGTLELEHAVGVAMQRWSLRSAG